MTDGIRIIGIDPGSHATGWGVVQASPVLRHVASGVIRPGRDLALPLRLLAIHDQLAAVIAEHAPQVMVVESLFNARNARSSLVLGHARGAALLAGARAGLPVNEYAPGEIKKALTGNGQAGKEQVRFMVLRLLGLQGRCGLDQSDALAVALAYQGRLRTQGGRG
ncbi:MAG: crossover junction endodeoxyribonuclease RuvC [Candidatus Krumholzibacteriia bacterium]